MVVDAITKKMITYASKSHYKRTVSGQVAEERDLTKSELGGASTYYYTTGNESKCTPALYLTLEGTPDPFIFLKKD